MPEYPQRGVAVVQRQISDGTSRRGATLLPIARRPTPFTDRIVLAFELAGLRAAEVALPLSRSWSYRAVHSAIRLPPSALPQVLPQRSTTL